MSPNASPSQLRLELDKLNACIHCGMCLPACPTYRVTGSEAESPRGRLYLMKKLLEESASPQAVRPHLDNCLACHGCETACPSGVEYGRVLLATREDMARKSLAPLRFLKRLVFRWLLPNHSLLLWGGGLLRFYQQSGIQKLLRKQGVLRLIPGLEAREQLMPTLPPQHRPLSQGMVFGEPDGEPVALLIGCVMDVFYNPIHWDTVTVLVANGYRVHVPSQTCCGALAHHAGETDITRTLAKRNIERMLADNPRWIVVNSAGCGSSMKEYPHLLAEDSRYAERATQFAEKVVDITELLAKKPLAPFKTALLEKMTYHAACHLHHVQRVQQQPMDLVAQIPGIKLIPLERAEACCGSAGIFNIEHPELSGEILDEKMAHIRTACEVKGATTLLTGNPGCLLQIEKGVQDAGLPMQVRHPVSVLAQAYRDGTQQPGAFPISPSIQQEQS